MPPRYTWTPSSNSVRRWRFVSRRVTSAIAVARPPPIGRRNTWIWTSRSGRRPRPSLRSRSTRSSHCTMRASKSSSRPSDATAVSSNAGLGVETLLCHAQVARHVVRVATLRTRRAIERGDYDAAIGEVALVLRLVRDLRTRGLMITQLVSGGHHPRRLRQHGQSDHRRTRAPRRALRPPAPVAPRARSQLARRLCRRLSRRVSARPIRAPTDGSEDNPMASRRVHPTTLPGSSGV